MADPTSHPHLQDYEFVRELGRGGMGTVYLYRHAITHRPEVVKLLSPEVLERPINRDRFEREIRASFKLSHPNIVAAYSAHRVGDSLAFCMEYVDGDDLMRVVKENGTLTPGVAVGYAVQALYGLQHAYERGMVHRDIKPGNLMRTVVDGRTVIKVVDFGLAKLGGDPTATSDTHLTQYGQVLGTPDFIAPEQIRNTSGADIRSDIYSLGCTLYYLMTGRPPFRGESLFDLFEMHIHSEAPRLDLLSPEVPAGLASVVGQLMAKDPAERPSTPLAAVDLLMPFAQFGTHSSPALYVPADTGPAPSTVNTATVQRPPLTLADQPPESPSDDYSLLTPTMITPPASTRYRPVTTAPAAPEGLPGWVVPTAIGAFVLAGVVAAAVILGGGGSERPPVPDRPPIDTPRPLRRRPAVLRPSQHRRPPQPPPRQSRPRQRLRRR